MYLSSDFTVMTIGDGDLSFSRALLAHIAPENLIATTYDSEDTLRSKYSQNALDDLLEAGVRVFHAVDITDPQTFYALPLNTADIVIFNHPLVPTHKSYAQYQKERNKTANLKNRNLLSSFLHNSFSKLLSSSGERLCYITTKSVKPYSHWHIETSLTIGTSFQYLGSEAFDVKMFKNYMVRNVDRDKCVKHEASDIYVYSDKPEHQISERLKPFKYNQPEHCPICRKGPFENEGDVALHQNTRIHKAQQQYHDAWLAHLSEQRTLLDI